jgi:hypothetical protein
MARLRKLEEGVGELKQAMLQVTEVLVDQSNRMDAGFAELRGQVTDVRGQMTDLRGQVLEIRRESIELRRESMDIWRGLNDRLDRLIAATMEERTLGIDRLRHLERRVERLEERSGITP